MSWSNLGTLYDMSSRKPTDIDALSFLRGQIVKASFECLNAPDNVTRIYEGDLEPTIKDTPLNPIYTKIFDIPIQNLRGQEDQLDLQRNGFQYLKFAPKTYVHPEEDDKVSSYLEEVTELVKAELKADEVICYDYRFRKNQPKPSKDSIYGIDGRKNWDPVSNKPHIDQTAAGALRRIRRHLTSDEKARYLDGNDGWRLQIINAWKPLVHPVQDNPITLCDYSSTREEDLVIIEYHPTPDYAGEYYALRHNKNQRWYYLSDQTADEMLLFLSYDSHPSHGVRYCPHTSFSIPDAAKTVHARESIEARMIVITRVDEKE